MNKYIKKYVIKKRRYFSIYVAFMLPKRIVNKTTGIYTKYKAIIMDLFILHRSQEMVSNGI